MLKLLLHLARALARPALLGLVLMALLYLAVRLDARLEPGRESGELLIAGLTGFWTAHRRRHASWSFIVLAGSLAAMVVALAQLGLMLAIREPAGGAAGILLGRAALAGVMGGVVARLLQQRVVL